ncbi:MAG: tRNA 2-selenouridine(34) synthase MnmH, partial [Nanoarchaeota archaeon]|nr:tRNA 2-selenouridine(34) synthase MnmH [Nanoarchaeota archaeon]
MDKITVSEALKLENVVFVDTRTPKEFEECHIPGAFNVPILSDEERHIVGYMYKQVSKDDATSKAYIIFEKKKAEIIKQITKIKNETKASKVIIYCWRGGMRSKVITQLMIDEGFNAVQLDGGHKQYRAYVREKLAVYSFKPKLIVLYGLTGTGKSELIRNVDLPKIDLEDLAQHRSSLLGAVGLKPRGQKFFECLLFYELEKLKDEKFVIIEGESRKVGDRIIPEFLFSAMKNNCVNVKVISSIERRVKRIVPEYFDAEDKCKQLKDIFGRMRQLLSNKVIDQLLAWMDSKEHEKVTEWFLLNYYDGKYAFTVDNVKYDYELNNDGDGLSKLN